MKKVLIINTVGFQYNGINSVISNYLTNMNREGLRFVFPVYEDIMPSLKAELEALGETAVVSNRKKKITGYMRDLMGLMKDNFDAVHIHGNSGTMLIEVALAKLCGVKHVMIHSHSTRTNHPIVNRLLKAPMMCLADTCIACSRASGQWLYGNYPHTVLNNAVDLPGFRFSEESRETYRREFGIRDEFLIGHIGHFSAAKNHFFLIDIFREFHKLEPRSKLLLLSDGPRFEQVKAKVAELGLEDAVIFAGRRNDIAGIYSAMDLFILPSCWEGLPLVLVEAQANGLPVLASDVITEDAICTDRILYKSLEDGAPAWADQLMQLRDRGYDRTADTHPDIAAKGFDIREEAEKLRTIYFQ